MPTRSPAMSQSARLALEALVGDRLSCDGDVRQCHANCWTWIDAQPPDAVIFPNSIEELSQIVKIAEAEKLPLIPYGGGTSLEGHVNAPLGGVSVDMRNMDRILAVDTANMLCHVEAGVTLGQLRERLAGSDLFFSVDPGATVATLAGMAATRASGSNTVRYGSMRENVLSLRAVMSEGRVVSTSSEAPKSAAGYDLTHLLVGSEGTLGLIAELTLRLWPCPPAKAVLVATYDALDPACRTVMAGLRHGLKPARIELLDPLAVETINTSSSLRLVAAPTLMVELHGDDQDIARQIAQFQSHAKSNELSKLEIIRDQQACNRLWQARHDAFVALSMRWPGKSILATDVCVPVSALAEAVGRAQRDLDELGLVAPIVGHVGDGNFHVLPVWDPADERQCQAVRSLLERLSKTAISLNGTCTGEHGIGQGKIAFLEAEAGPGLEVMRAIKQALDPHGIFNPGKLFAS